MLKILQTLASLPTFYFFRRRLHSASDGFWRRKVGGRALEVDGRVLNPRAQAYIAFQSKMSKPLSEVSPQALRHGFDMSVDFFDGPKAPLTEVREITLPLYGRDIGARCYSDKATASGRPLILYFHGGGFVIGSLKSHDRFCRNLAKTSRCDVISVDYRLAPEHKMPAAFDDAIDSWDWLQENAGHLGIDPAKISVAGDSAGALLAVLVAAEVSKRRDAQMPLALGLIYPPMPEKPETNSRALLGQEQIVLTSELLDWFAGHFSPENPKKHAHRLRFLEEAVAGRIPPTWILTCGFDPLRDDGQMMAERLQVLEAEVKIQEYDDLYHGFITLSGIFPQVNTLITDMSAFIGTELDRQRLQIAAE